MREKFTIANITVEPGAVQHGRWQVAESYDNSPVEIPIAVINGVNDGPCVWVQCAVHGDEYVGVAAIQELLKNVDPQQLSGIIVALPWVNVLAFRAGARMAPQDGMDMNRVYPGQSIDQAMHLFAHTELVIHEIFQEMKKADVILDLHDGGRMGRMSPYIQYFTTGEEVDRRSRDLAFASGMDIIWESPPGFVEKKAPGSVGTVTTGMGIPTLTIEIGGEGRIPADDVRRMYLSVDNILKKLQMIPGEIQPHGADQKLVVRQGNWLRPKRGGVFVGYVTPGQLVKKGDLICDVRDPFGQVIEELVAPIDGVVIGIRTYGIIASGQYAGNVAEVIPADS